ncbi:sigma-54-dependent transcriptional regulator [Teichococcus oryzae]|uniref:Sigma-54-dependent Fis family transcriptional regulator n=1 Tax=Teichococcus oryzae TaxID=1608942 RepID=A0A5B2TDC4_9PROT|nr:sigma-54 dependent transcriptional regulator [Pseudoroseomonas oryzae]KAA2212486.1 sigma-54-dependent Fis family transcriptional regulator [Pseudoroseomonas oryzae]
MADGLDVLFVDDDAMLREANLQSFSLAGLHGMAVPSAERALEVVDDSFPGVVVTDIRMPGMDGLALFRRLREIDADLPVILITGHGDIPMAVGAIREGAYDFLPKPFPAETLMAALRRALEKRRLVLENRRLAQAVAEAAGDTTLLGESPSMERLRQTLKSIAGTDVDVLIEGETGSGKDMVASALHRWSHRANRPFVALNCGALPETVIESELFGHEAGAFTGAQKRRVGRIEHADGGTLFLDEIDAMSPAVQVKLLRVLESREVAPLGTNEVRRLDLRIAAATKVPLLDLVQRGVFREDLYYRLHVVTLRVPPLRERRADIPLLFAHFLERAAKRFGRPVPQPSEAVRQRLASHDWPGNVRELTHYAERVALALAEEDQAPPAPQPAVPLPERVDAYEASLIAGALAAHGGDVRAALEVLRIPRKTFYDKLRRHNIDQTAFRPPRGG